jgi:hypothetical protein
MKLSISEQTPQDLNASNGQEKGFTTLLFVFLADVER